MWVRVCAASFNGTILRKYARKYTRAERRNGRQKNHSDGGQPGEGQSLRRRDYGSIRDLGIGEATGGKVHAHIIRTTKPCPEGGSGMHYHDVDFQMVMVLKGRSRVWFEGQGEVEFEEGDCWIQPPGIKHNVLYYSEDYELLELTLPENYETVQVEG